MSRDGGAARSVGRFLAALTRRLAQAILVTLSIGGALALSLQIASWPDHPLADMTHQTWWTRIIVSSGIERAYEGVYPETYVIYPPGMAYGFRSAAWLSEHVQPPPWIPESDWLRVCIKLIPVAGHGALALILFAMAAAAGGFWRGWLAATLYAWNPAALFDAAYWGQGDTLHTALLALTVAVLFAFPAWWPPRAAGRWRWAPAVLAIIAGGLAGGVLATAGLTKPQAWVFLPLIGWLIFRRTGPLGMAAAGATGMAAAWLIVQPWLLTGRMDEMTSVFGNVAQVMPSVSANGHNLWWLKLPGDALAVLDWQPVGGFGEWATPEYLTHGAVGRLAFGALALLPLLRLTGPLNVRLAMACMAYTAAAYFMTITQVHENHMFAAIPFLAAAAALDFWFLAPFLIASVCVFANMALHDFMVGDPLSAWLATRLPWSEPLVIQTMNARLNVAGFALFTLLLLRRPTVARQSVGGLLWRARFVLLMGLLLAGGALAAVRLLLRNEALLLRLWDALLERALAVGPVEAHIGRKTPAEELAAHAAVDLANALLTLAAVAAIVGTLAALAGTWWLICAQWTRYHQSRPATPLSTLLEQSEQPGPPKPSRRARQTERARRSERVGQAGQAGQARGQSPTRDGDRAPPREAPAAVPVEATAEAPVAMPVSGGAEPG